MTETTQKSAIVLRLVISMIVVPILKPKKETVRKRKKRKKSKQQFDDEEDEEDDAPFSDIEEEDVVRDRGYAKKKTSKKKNKETKKKDTKKKSTSTSGKKSKDSTSKKSKTSTGKTKSSSTKSSSKTSKSSSSSSKQKSKKKDTKPSKSSEKKSKTSKKDSKKKSKPDKDGYVKPTKEQKKKLKSSTAAFMENLDFFDQGPGEGGFEDWAKKINENFDHFLDVASDGDLMLSEFKKSDLESEDDDESEEEESPEDESESESEEAANDVKDGNHDSSADGINGNSDSSDDEKLILDNANNSVDNKTASANNTNTSTNTSTEEPKKEHRLPQPWDTDSAIDFFDGSPGWGAAKKKKNSIVDILTGGLDLGSLFGGGGGGSNVQMMAFNDPRHQSVQLISLEETLGGVPGQVQVNVQFDPSTNSINGVNGQMANDIIGNILNQHTGNTEGDADLDDIIPEGTNPINPDNIQNILSSLSGGHNPAGLMAALPDNISDEQRAAVEMAAAMQQSSTNVVIDADAENDDPSKFEWEAQIRNGAKGSF